MQAHAHTHTHVHTRTAEARGVCRKHKIRITRPKQPPIDTHTHTHFFWFRIIIDFLIIHNIFLKVGGCDASTWQTTKCFTDPSQDVFSFVYPSIIRLCLCGCRIGTESKWPLLRQRLTFKLSWYQNKYLTIPTCSCSIAHFILEKWKRLTALIHFNAPLRLVINSLIIPSSKFTKMKLTKAKSMKGNCVF